MSRTAQSDLAGTRFPESAGPVIEASDGQWYPVSSPGWQDRPDPRLDQIRASAPAFAARHIERAAASFRARQLLRDRLAEAEKALAAVREAVSWLDETLDSEPPADGTPAEPDAEALPGVRKRVKP